MKNKFKYKNIKLIDWSLNLKYKPMECPVCHKTYFLIDKENYRDELEGFANGEMYCEHCGWTYDLNQVKNPDCKEGFNELSLNEYKNKYKELIKTNPNYDYYEEHLPKKEPHMCPVCGRYEFEDECSYDICPFCGWEDDGFFEGGGANYMSLEEAKVFYQKKIRENPNFNWEEEKDKEFAEYFKE